VRGSAHPTVVVVEGNRELGQFLERLMSDAGWDVIVAGTAAEARRLTVKRKPHAVFAEAELPDDRGVALMTQLCRAYPELRGIVMTDGALPMEENATRVSSGVMILAKPFTAREANIVVRSRPLSETFGRFDDSPKAA
jgi:DNA-binding response OmpR family regulator